MWILLAFLGCSGAPSLPDGAVSVTLDPQGLRLSDRPISTLEELGQAPSDGIVPPLVEALSGTDEVWARIDDAIPWAMSRKVLSSADGAEVSTFRWVQGDRAFNPSRTLQGTWRRLCPDDARLTGIAPAWTLQVHQGASGMWLEAHVRFRPLIASGAAPAQPMENLAPGCAVQGASCEILEGAARQACQGHTQGRARVAIGGPAGCVLPIATEPGEATGWEAPLARWIRAFGIQPTDDVVLIPEATVPFAGIAPVLGAFTRLEQPSPTLGQLLIEGNDGPPDCEGHLRDREALDQAAGAWLAGWLARGPTL